MYILLEAALTNGSTFDVDGNAVCKSGTRTDTGLPAATASVVEIFLTKLIVEAFAFCDTMYNTITRNYFYQAIKFD